MWFSLGLVLSKDSFLLCWPFLYLLLPICFLSSLTLMYPSCQIPLSASFISLFSSASLWRDKPLPAFPFFPLTGFSFLFSYFCPFFPLVFITFLSFFSVDVSVFSISWLPLYNTFPSFISWYSPSLPHLHLPLLPHIPSFPSRLLFFFSSSFASSIGWLSLRSLPWSLRRLCTTTSTRGPQTTSTFRQGNGS